MTSTPYGHDNFINPLSTIVSMARPTNAQAHVALLTGETVTYTEKTAT